MFLHCLQYAMRKEQLYLLAKNRFPGQLITPTGGHKTLHTCYLSYPEIGINLTLTFNVGKATFMEIEK